MIEDNKTHGLLKFGQEIVGQICQAVGRESADQKCAQPFDTDGPGLMTVRSRHTSVLFRPWGSVV
jgi:hypothetical protein